jgi:hypothetical protein
MVSNAFPKAPVFDVAQSKSLSDRVNFTDFQVRLCYTNFIQMSLCALVNTESSFLVSITHLEGSLGACLRVLMSKHNCSVAPLYSASRAKLMNRSQT